MGAAAGTAATRKQAGILGSVLPSQHDAGAQSGGLWDESMKLYPATGGVPAQSVILWQWPGGGKVKFAHLEHEAASWIGKARRFR